MRRHAFGFIVLAAALLTRCGGSPASPSPAGPALSERIVTAHFVFHYAPGDRVDSAWQEGYHAWAVQALGVNPPVIDYNKYMRRAHMGALTGRSTTNGYAEPAQLVIHTIWEHDNHEVVHVYTGPWGFPVALFVEGLAVAHQTNPAANDLVARWSSTPVHDLARRFRDSGQLPSIVALAETSAFRSRDDGITYPVAGSFVRFLIDMEGIAAMRRLYGSMPNDAGAAAVRAAFLQVYGFTLDEAERRWLDFLKTG